MGERQNNFLAFRFLFATLVMLSHAPEIIDGDRQREILTRIFGTVSFGDVGVDGFFLISGYLITQSWESTNSLTVFLQKRLFRIAPGYLVAYAICVAAGVFVAADPAGYFGAIFSVHGVVASVRSITSLGMPFTPEVFAGQHYPTVNASMWTLQYEFECYLAVALLGNIGLLHRAVLIPVAAVLMFLSGIHAGEKNWAPETLLVFFCSGALFYLCRGFVLRRVWVLAVIGVMLAGLLFFQYFAVAALAVCGGALLFAAVFAPSDKFLWINKLPDFSYGLYLYGWPAERFLVWYFPAASPWIVFVVAWPIAACCGLASWFAVEKPALALAKNWRLKRIGSQAALFEKSAQKLL
jgi:peptidoglycan/LPS O-acetylase OafA/YrhL